MGELVDQKRFDDVNHTKILFSMGGGANSTKEGALFTALKVSICTKIISQRGTLTKYIYNDFSDFGPTSDSISRGIQFGPSGYERSSRRCRRFNL